jgi:hypothetical protein
LWKVKTINEIINGEKSFIVAATGQDQTEIEDLTRYSRINLRDHLKIEIKIGSR